MSLNIDELVHEIGVTYDFWSSLPFDPPNLIKYWKDSLQMHHHCIAGNQYLQASDWENAALCFTKMVAAACKDNSDLAKAYERRSCALFMQRKLVPSLLDSNRAFSIDKCPPDLKNEVKSRGDESYRLLRMGQTNFRLRRRVTDPIKAVDLQTESEWRNLCDLRNAKLPGTSPKIEIKIDERCGRHMVATQNIEPGNKRNTFFCFRSAVELR